jgi:signal transduction histidine kinase
MERKQIEQQLKTLNETLEQRVAERTAVATRRAAQLQMLASELTRTEQRERRRLAQILHDELQQTLYAARLSLGTLRTRIEEKSLLETIGRVDELLSQSIAQSRSLTSQLSPPALYEAGLAAALEWLGRHVHESYRLVVDVEADPDVEAATDDLRILLFEATRELLFNVVKHARTGSARVAMTAPNDGELQIVVTDDGAGFNPAEPKIGAVATPGFGLFSIRERLELLGGRMQVDATLGRGTRISVSAPRRRRDGVPSKPRMNTNVPTGKLP